MVNSLLYLAPLGWPEHRVVKVVKIYECQLSLTELTDRAQQSSTRPVVCRPSWFMPSNMSLTISRIPIEVGFSIMKCVQRTVKMSAGEGRRPSRWHFSRTQLSTCSSSYGVCDYAQEQWTAMYEKLSKKSTPNYQSSITNCYVSVRGYLKPIRPNQLTGTSIDSRFTNAWSRRDTTSSVICEDTGMILPGRSCRPN